MAVAVSEHEAQDLRRLIPLNMLSGDRFEQLCDEVMIEDAPRGSVLFSKGDTKSEFVYVLKGTISLQADGMELETITGGTESSRFALAHQIPRKVSAIAKDKVRFVRIDSSFVNQPNGSLETRKANYEVVEVRREEENDWVTTLLSSPIFQRLSPASLQQLLRNLEEIQVKAGHKVVEQDEPGDYYYVIKEGRCALSRRPAKNARDIKLAELKTCDTFGEDSLISDQPRNVTITMLTDGSLLRLNKENFLKLVKEPVISYVDFAAAQELVKNGARWLDVRPADEFAQQSLGDAVNIPFFVLRMELGNLNRSRPYVLVCETGRVSEAAAFLLIRNSFDAFVLRGGLAAIPDRATYLTEAPTAGLTFQSDATSSALRMDTENLDLTESVTASALSVEESIVLDEALDSRIDMSEMESGLFDDEPDSVSLRSKLAEALANASRLEAELAATRAGGGSAQGGDTGNERLRLTERARVAAEGRVKALEGQVAELSAVVQEFVEQQQAGGESDELQSVRSELETVRGQATADVMSLQGKLKASEQEVARLRRELDGTYAQVLQLQSGVDLSRPTKRDAWATTVVPTVIAIVAFILGMVLTLVLVRSTDFGRSLLAESEHASGMVQITQPRCLAPQEV